MLTILDAGRFALAAALGLSASSASAQVVRAGAGSPFTVTPIYSFSGGVGGATFNLTVDSDGALYGTALGGAHSNGMVFKLSPPGPGNSRWTETVLYSFSGPDGSVPIFTPILDSHGALYGATMQGGANNLGVVFKLTPPVPPSTQWAESTIFEFSYSTINSVGFNPAGVFVGDNSGALYGTALHGGAINQGAVYKLTPPVPPATQWTAAAIYNFASGADGSYPGLSLIMDSSGALYGGSRYGGNGYGVVFKLTPPGGDCAPTAPNLWCETTLYSFSGGADGSAVIDGVTMDSHGALYGVTPDGGAYGHGQLFKLTPPTPPSTQWSKTTLYSFTGGADGASPYATPVLIGGALYGTTSGGTPCSGNSLPCGTIYQLKPPFPPSTQWTQNTLWTFTGAADGAGAVAGLPFAPADFGLGVAVYGSAGNSIFTLQCAPRARLISGGALQTAGAQ
jgi:uncharacterized repeat protein (TIGR03803 family)